MKTLWFYKKIQNSIFLKALSTTLIFSLVILGAIGITLYSRISNGIYNEKIQSSIVEAQSTIISAQYRFNVSLGRNEVSLNKLTNDIVSSAKDIGALESSHEVAIFKSPVNNRPSPNLERFSNSLVSTSVPLELRKKIRETEEKTVSWQLTDIYYENGRHVKGIAVGKILKIPNAGQYEMYLLFTFANQNSALEIISRLLWFAGLATILLIFGMASIVIRQVVSPVREAAKIAEELTAGELSKRMKVHGDDEISRLGMAFNEMALSLQQQISRLKNLSTLQQRFVSDVSHELRTPLTTIRLAVDVIYAARKSFDPTIVRSTELLVAQIDRFELLLSDLLEVSRFDAEAAVLTIVDFDFKEMVTRSVADLSLVAQEQSTEIEIRSADSAIILQGDPRRVERIVRNLLSNALEHCDAKPIILEIRESQTDVSLGVRDFGIGIEPAHLAKVFDRFWKADPARTRSRGGTGLGLSIALEDARLHGGTLNTWGELRKGAHFVLTLPKQNGIELQSSPIIAGPENS